jgi:hypothetical protein
MLPICKTSCSKVASVTVSGWLVRALAPLAPACFNAAPHLPQTGWRALDALSSTRFLEPHLAQTTTITRFFSFSD